MRTMTLLAGLMLAAALVTFVPAAEATGDIDCIEYKDRVVVCLDPCYYQSDCCRYSGFWCPEYEES